jgi:hypothetical protein
MVDLSCPTPTAWCEDEECVMGALGEENMISSSDDEEDLLDPADGVTTRWLVRHEGVMANISCEEIIDHPHGTFVIMPEVRHCAVSLDTGDRLYLEFIASSSTCHGWTECECDPELPKAKKRK